MKSSLRVLDSAPLRNAKIYVPGLGSVLQTEDDFLYSRCACVLSGCRAYEGVLRDVRNFKKYLEAELHGAEGLLYLAGEVYERKTGEEMTLD
ncbi:DUF4240 domain-containing protein [Nocardiopsis ganjiahuensis]|uniref:DUF4240 domain-containing protein n=1 Tax=Nocardiopsis ganjiahuensis TaxID=239984 RepID=UPI0009FBF0C3